MNQVTIRSKNPNDITLDEVEGLARTIRECTPEGNCAGVRAV